MSKRKGSTQRSRGITRGPVWPKWGISYLLSYFPSVVWAGGVVVGSLAKKETNLRFLR